jgi:polyketide synthase 5
MIDPADGAYAFELLLRHDRGYVGYSPLDRAPWLTALAARSPFGAGFSEARPTLGNPAHHLRAELKQTPPNELPTIIRRVIIEQVGLILRRTVSPDRPFFEFGLDSLGSLQLLMALEASTSIRLNAANLTNVRELAVTLSEAMRENNAFGSDTHG